MRLTDNEIQIIRDAVLDVLGENTRIVLFGSRVDDTLKGGDIDLMIELDQKVDRPALQSARVAGRVSRLLSGRKVDVVLKAPNLKSQPVHEIATQTGSVL
jgi:predicted nucleotidyltransferase